MVCSRLLGFVSLAAVAFAACDEGPGRVPIFNPNASGDDDDDGGDTEDDGDGKDDGDDGAEDTTGGPIDDGVDDLPDPDADDDGPKPTTGPGDDGAINVCGDHNIADDEVCDGSDLGGENCVSQGFDKGDLHCLADCSGYDTSGCETFACGDGMAEGEEACDGDDLKGEDCVSLGYDGGTLACKADCSAFEPHHCITADCGDDVVEGLELCDGSSLAGETCVSLGFNGGTLSCSETCTAFDSSECECAEGTLGGPTGAVVDSGNLDAEDDTLAISCAMGGGADHIVEFTAPTAGSYVFDTVDSEFDTALAAFDSCDPSSELACNDDVAGQQSEITLDLAAGQTVLIAVDGWNGETGDWVLNINAGTDACVETVVTTLGSPAAAGNTTQQDEDIGQGCANGGSVDHLIRFVAPATGTFVFDTYGSSYDTALAAYTSCDPEDELVCNDDAGGTTQSQISLGMMAGQSVLVAVSGYNGATGNWELNITQS